MSSPSYCHHLNQLLNYRHWEEWGERPTEGNVLSPARPGLIPTQFIRPSTQIRLLASQTLHKKISALTFP